MQIAVVQECTGYWEASPDNLQRNGDGTFTFTNPNTKEKTNLGRSVPQHIQAKAAAPPPIRLYCGKYYCRIDNRDKEWRCNSCQMLGQQKCERFFPPWD